MDKNIKMIMVISFWVGLWGVLSLIFNNAVIFPGPYDVLRTMFYKMIEPFFWLTVGGSMLRILIGFIIACLSGCLLAIIGYRIPLVHDFISPVIQLMKSAPIVCIIVLLLVWFGVEIVDVVTVIIAVTPIFFFAIAEACQNRDKNIANMLKVHKVPTDTIWRVFEWPGVLPYFNQAAQTGIGISWKSAVTAQMIGAVAYTIGEGVFTSKITLDSATLVVWLMVVVVLGWTCEKIIIAIIRNLTKKWELKGVEISERDPERKIDVDKQAKLLISEITKIYNKKKVLDKYSLNMQAGDRIALTGPTGSGKTTLIRIIMGIESCNHGEVFTKDYEPRTYSAVFQECTLLPNLSVDENIMVIANKYSNDELVPGNLMPDELSGGMKRCAEIERALLAQSQIVILDEPFAGLDSSTKTKAIKYIDEHLSGRMLILITHDKKDAKRLKCSLKD